jgi:hypothetical protein
MTRNTNIKTSVQRKPVAATQQVKRSEFTSAWYHALNSMTNSSALNAIISMNGSHNGRLLDTDGCLLMLQACPRLEDGTLDVRSSDSVDITLKSEAAAELLQLLNDYEKALNRAYASASDKKSVATAFKKEIKIGQSRSLIIESGDLMEGVSHLALMLTLEKFQVTNGERGEFIGSTTHILSPSFNLCHNRLKALKDVIQAFLSGSYTGLLYTKYLILNGVLGGNSNSIPATTSSGGALAAQLQQATSDDDMQGGFFADDDIVGGGSLGG